MFDEGERPLIRSFVSDAIGLDRRVPRHHATVGGMVISVCSAANRLQARISISQIYLAVSLWEAKFCCFSPRQVKLC